MSDTPLNDQKPQTVKTASEAVKGLSLLTGKQYDQAANYADLIRREIQAGDKDEIETKKFIDRQANDFCLHEKFGNFKAKEILTNQYIAKFGETPDEHRERLSQKAERLNEADKDLAYQKGMQLPEYLEELPDPRSHIAYGKLSNHLAHDLKISEKKARSLIVQVYKERHNGKNYFNDFAKVEEKCVRREKNLPDLSQSMQQKASPGM